MSFIERWSFLGCENFEEQQNGNGNGNGNSNSNGNGSNAEAQSRRTAQPQNCVCEEFCAWLRTSYEIDGAFFVRAHRVRGSTAREALH